MKFIFADSLDVVDANFDFVRESTGAERKSNSDDWYPHEMLFPAPYHGVLISRAIVGDHRYPGKYTLPQAMRLQREGARKFLRLSAPRFREMMIVGDCGAFAYAHEKEPRYQCGEMLDFYNDGQFTHGCSVDHIIFDFDREERGPVCPSKQSRERWEITLENAREFLKLSANLGPRFTPIGVVQGWSPSSMANAAANLEQMGYTYIAIGGIAPLGISDIHRCLEAIRQRVRPSMRIHLLGFAKAETGGLVRYNVESFDSSSPILRAFKDARANYYMLTKEGLEYYTAVRIPQAIENLRLTRAAREGRLNQEQLLQLESAALKAVRGYDQGMASLEEAVECVAEYGSLLAPPDCGTQRRGTLRDSIRVSVHRTLLDRPWRRCGCEICRTIGVEVVIYRGANRNKRRGFHNLAVYHQHLRRQSLELKRRPVHSESPRKGLMNHSSPLILQDDKGNVVADGRIDEFPTTSLATVSFAASTHITDGQCLGSLHCDETGQVDSSRLPGCRGPESMCTLDEDFVFAQGETQELGFQSDVMRYVAAINPEVTRNQFIEAAARAGYKANSAYRRFMESRALDVADGQVEMLPDGRLRDR